MSTNRGVKNGFSEIRREYRLKELSESEVSANPVDQFEKWFNDAVRAGLLEPNAMVLSTVGANQRPSSRAVLMKDFDREGFVFYSNYESLKAQQIDCCNFVSLLFLWVELERQIRIEGQAFRLNTDKSDKYFSERPRSAQIGAHVSIQSSVIVNREELEARYEEVETSFCDKVVPRPDSWGGYIVKPDRFEFWQGRESRLHDRIVYRKQDGPSWDVFRLSP